MKAVISTNEVVRQWVNMVDYHRTPQQRETLFYDWLNEIRVEAWLEGAESAYYDVEIRGFVNYPENPYEKGN